jgi:hypothetical protein
VSRGQGPLGAGHMRSKARHLLASPCKRGPLLEYAAKCEGEVPLGCAPGELPCLPSDGLRDSSLRLRHAILLLVLSIPGTYVFGRWFTASRGGAAYDFVERALHVDVLEPPASRFSARPTSDEAVTCNFDVRAEPEG